MSRIKGISIWEQYIEHFVLAVVTLAAIAFVAMQFIGNPNAIERQPHGLIKPGAVDETLRAEAARVERLLRGSGLEFVDPPPLLAEFDRRLTMSVNPANRIGPYHAHVPLRIGERDREDVIYVVPEVPPARSLIARQYHDTLLDETVEEHRLERLFTEKPYDVSWISVGGIFDKDKVLEQFKTGGPDGTPAPLPSNWYFDMVMVVNVVLERERYEGGEWVDLMRLEPIPGQLTFRDLLSQDVESSRRDTLLRSVREQHMQRQLLQPSFYPTRSGAWVAPDPFEQVDDRDGEVAVVQRLIRRRDLLMSRRDDLKRQLEEAAGSPRDPGRGPGPGGGGLAPGGGGGLAGPGGGMEGGGGTRGGGRDSSLAVEGLQRRLEEVERDLARVIRDLENLIGDDAAKAPPALTGEVVLWAHDLDVRSGETYRYRFIVEVYNPFCARKLNLLEEQHHLAESFVLASHPSEWTDPITVEPPVRTFITRVELPSRDQRPSPLVDSLATATFEIYRFHDGNWHSATFAVRPGERVGAVRTDRATDRTTETPIDFGTDWYVLDVVPDPDATRSDVRAARVILQNLRTGEIAERHPLWDGPGRDRLRQEIQLATRAALGPR